MEEHIDIISELIEFANRNWSAFTEMLKERGFKEMADEAMTELEDDLYS